MWSTNFTGGKKKTTNRFSEKSDRQQKSSIITEEWAQKLWGAAGPGHKEEKTITESISV